MLIKNRPWINPDQVIHSRNKARISYALAVMGKHIYLGTVDPAEKARRRKANKAARPARKAARR